MGKKILIILSILLIVLLLGSKIMMRFRPIPSQRHESNFVSQKEAQYKDKIAEYERLASYLDTYVEYINQKDYKSAYALITADCKEDYKMTLQSYSKNLTELFTTEKSIDLINYIELESGTYLTHVNYYTEVFEGDSQYTDLVDILDTVIIHEGPEGFTLSINGFISSKKLPDKKYNSSAITIAATALTRYENKAKLHVEISNSSQNDVVLTGKIYAIDAEGKKYFVNDTLMKSSGILLESSSRRQMQLEFKNVPYRLSAIVLELNNNIGEYKIELGN